MNLLHTLGLMKRSELEAATRWLRECLFDSEQKRIHWQGEANEANAKFKRAATDLAAQAEAIAGLKQHVMSITRDRNSWREEANTLRPDALAMRRKRQMDRDRAAGKRGKAA